MGDYPATLDGWTLQYIHGLLDRHVFEDMTLDGWTLQYIHGLLDRHVFEDIAFDWKESLSPAGGQFRKNAAGMPNNSDGFFVFGVTNDRAGEPADRLKGLDRDVDVAKLLSDQIAGPPVDPGILFLVGQPTTIGDGSRVIVVAQVLGSRALHSIEGVFHGRTPGSTRYLATTEVINLVISA